jgi:hypothetical protein
MTVLTGTFQSFQSLGNREDLEDIIYNIAPTETPFLSMASKTKATARLHEWQTDSLASAGTNQAIEGDDAANTTAVPTVRVGNYCQISQKAFGVSGTQEAINKAGRKSELAYQLAKRSKELKRDMEYALTRNQGSSAGGAGTAQSMASTESWMSSNLTSLGTGTAQSTPGYSGGVVAAPTDSSAAGTISEAALKAVIKAVWTSGGDPGVILCGPFNKQKISAFAGIATQYKVNTQNGKRAQILGAADSYISDFGEHRVIPSRFNRDATVQIMDMDYWAVAYLRPFQQYALAKTGDAERRQLLVEYTLVARQQAASGKIADLTTS